MQQEKKKASALSNVHELYIYYESRDFAAILTYVAGSERKQKARLHKVASEVTS